MRIGPYEVIRELGRGSFAAVFLARKEGLPRQFAVKVLTKVRGDTDLARFKREAKVTSGLDHPGIVGCSDLGVDERGYPYLVLDYASGGTLADRLKAGPLPVKEAVELAAQLADALSYAHERGVLHRDLKPANVLFNSAGRPVLSDFGLANLRGDLRLTASIDIIGTPYYMAPEQFDRRSVTPQVDLYGLGAILYRALTGDVPHRAEDWESLRRAVHGSAPPRPSEARPEVPEAVDEVVVTALARDPDDRYMSAADMAEALRASLEAPAAPPPGAASRLPLVLGGAAVGLVALLGLAWALSGPASQPEDPDGDVAELPPPDPPPDPPPPASEPPPVTRPPATDPQVSPLVRLEAAIERWGFREAERLISVARDGGEDPVAIARLAGALDDARAAEKAACKAIDESFDQDLRAAECLTRAEQLLAEHPESLELRFLASHLAANLARYEESLAYMNEAIDRDAKAADQRLQAQRFLRELAQRQRRDPWIDPPPLDIWRPVHGGQWRLEAPGQLRARFPGMAQFGFAGLVHVPAGELRAPYEVSVEIDLDTSQEKGFAGLILGMQDADNALLVYILHDTRLRNELSPEQHAKLDALRGFSGDKALRYAYWRNSRWQQIGDDVGVEFPDDGWATLSVRVADGALAATVQGKPVQPVQVRGSLDGKIGLLKWFEDEVAYRNLTWR